MAVPKITALDAFETKFNWLVYADPGAGKTVLGGTAPNALIVSFDPDGTESAKRMGSKAKVTAPADLAETEDLVKWLKAGNAKQFEWIVVDNLTTMHSRMWRGILDSVRPGNDQARIQDYGTIQAVFKRVYNAFLDMPCNVLFLAHAMSEEDEEGNPLVIPDIPGKWGTNDPMTASRFVCAGVGLLGYLKVDTAVDEATGKSVDTRRLIIQRTGPYVAKNRYNGVFVNRKTGAELTAIRTLDIAAMAAKISAPAPAATS